MSCLKQGVWKDKEQTNPSDQVIFKLFNRTKNISAAIHRNNRVLTIINSRFKETFKSILVKGLQDDKSTAIYWNRKYTYSVLQ